VNFDLFVEKAAPDVRLNSIDDPIIETRPLAAESEAVILEGVPEAEPIAGRIFSIPPFGKPRSARRLRNDACRCSDTKELTATVNAKANTATALAILPRLLAYGEKKEASLIDFKAPEG
jgi:hypothetical protein